MIKSTESKANRYILFTGRCLEKMRTKREDESTQELKLASPDEEEKINTHDLPSFSTASRHLPLPRVPPSFNVSSPSPQPDPSIDLDLKRDARQFDDASVRVSSVRSRWDVARG